MSDLCKRFSRTERQIQLIQNQRHVSVASRHRVSHRPSHYFPGRFGKGLPMQIWQALINAVDADLPAKPILRAVREEPTRSKMLLEITSDKWHAYSTYMNNHERMTVTCSIMQQHTVTSWTSSQQLAAKSIWINLNFKHSVFVLSPKTALTSMLWDEWKGVKHFSDSSPQVGWQQWRFEGVDGTWWNDGTTWNLIFQFFPICSNMFQYFTILAVWCRNGVRMVSEDLGCTCQAKLKLATDELDSKAVQWPVPLGLFRTWVAARWFSCVLTTVVFIVLVKTVRCHWCSPKHELYWVLEAALAAEASGEQLEKSGPLCLVGASQIVIRL